MSNASKLGPRSTPQDALGGVSLAGKVAIVTGANSGIGAETARVLALGGAHVVMGCRSVAAGEQVAGALRAGLPAGAGSIEVQALDLADLTSLRAVAGRYLPRGRPRPILGNNAGGMGTARGKTAQGFERRCGTQH